MSLRYQPANVPELNPNFTLPFIMPDAVVQKWLPGEVMIAIIVIILKRRSILDAFDS